jgi:signal transduction histidine kinase
VNCLFPDRSVEYHLEKDLPLLSVSPEALHQVLSQLLRNAVRAGAGQSPVHVELGARRTVDGVEFEVSDNGRGLDDSRVERLFEPFLPGDPGSGFGLGLFLIRQLVASWGGALRIRSEPVQGTRISVLVRIETT